jgi:dihydropteroate synthase
VGVINVTPDSFSDGGEFFGTETAVARAKALLDEGAQVIDVGGESTRPGSDPVSPEEELRRVLPVIRGILSACPDTTVSIDTYRSSTAEAALDSGAAVVNDVTALGDPKMAGLVAERGCPIILMHMLGEPKSMQQDPRYEDVVRELRDFLAERAERAVRAGVEPENVILDPGIGFGKTLEHNLQLLNHLDSLVELGFPVLVGISRKSFLGKIAGSEDPKSRLFGTVAANVLAYERGATLFRVHDVRPNGEALAVAAAIREA